MKYILTFLAIFSLTVTSLAIANDAPQSRKTIEKKSKRQLSRENKKMAYQMDSLRAVIAEYQDRIAREDSIKAEMLNVYEENSHRLGAGLSPNDYNNAVTDSLLDFWYLNRQTMQSHEGEEYDMDSVHFSSNVPDKVFLDRLANLHSFITLPYNETVRNYIILYADKMPTKVQQMLGLAAYYMPIFEETFNRYDMPEELKYLAVIESAFNPVAVSRAGAKGMWQFMYNTAKLYGLKIDSFVDERLDAVKSADAAARYLQDAYGIFGDWNLAISSYNCGAGNVNKAIRRSGGKRDFWSIYPYLPRETRGYVPAMVGAMYAFNYYKEHGMSPSPVQMPAHVDTFEIRKMVHFKQISEVAHIPLDVIKELNPQYMHDIIPGSDKPYILRLPYNYAGTFLENEDSIYTYKAAEFFNPTELQKIKDTGFSDSDRLTYKVKSGDNLGRIASRYHVTVKQLQQWNHLRNTNLRIGQKLIIYRRGGAPKTASTSKSTVSSSKATSAKTNITTSKSSNDGTVTKSSATEVTASAAKSSAGYVTYTVKSGDTLYSIARNYPGISANDIMAFNGIGSKIKVGMKIKIPQR